MMDVFTEVISPYETQDLMTLEEAKTLLGIGSEESTSDDQIGLLIRMASGEIAAELGRTLAREIVTDTFVVDMPARRLYLSHWPVVEIADVTAFTIDGTDVIADTTGLDPLIVLEKNTGTLYRSDSTYWSGTIKVTYIGGYSLPEEAPDALKQALSLGVQDAYYAAIKGDSSIRSIMHKETRIMYFSPQQMTATTGKSSSGSMRSLNNLIAPFRRTWV
jgi:hypothetical protein